GPAQLDANLPQSVEQGGIRRQHLGGIELQHAHDFLVYQQRRGKARRETALLGGVPPQACRVRGHIHPPRQCPRGAYATDETLARCHLQRPCHLLESRKAYWIGEMPDGGGYPMAVSIWCRQISVAHWPASVGTDAIDRHLQGSGGTGGCIGCHGDVMHQR